MPPTFKKPLGYDPALAEETLKKTFVQTELGQQAKKRSMLAELGLADEEGFDVEDEEDEEELDENGESVAPKGMANGSANGHGNGKATYGFKDIFGKDYEKRRQDLIRVKGYDKYLRSLIDNSDSALQELRAERNKLDNPSLIEVIPELQTELELLYLELQKAQKQLNSTADQRVDELHDTIRLLKGELKLKDQEIQDRENSISDLHEQLRATGQQVATKAELLKQKDEAAKALQQQLRSIALNDQADNSSLSVQLKQLQAVRDRLEHQLDAAHKEIEQLKINGGSLQATRSEPVGHSSRNGSSVVEEAGGGTIELLKKKLADADEKLQRQEAEYQKKLAAAQGDSATRIAELEAELKALTQRADNDVAAARSSMASSVNSKVSAMQQQLVQLHALRQGIMTDLKAMQTELFSEKSLKQMLSGVRDREIDALKRVYSEASTEVASLKAQVKAAEDELSGMQAQFEHQLRVKQLEAEGLVSHFREKWKVEFDKRRKLHNQVIELKGNIRVLCRVRPLLSKEAGAAGGDLPVKCLDEETVRVVSDKSDKEFEFDRVFSPQEGQAAVFDEVCALVTSVLDGYKVSIMAYGQTGSGKTYTMEGPESDRGVNMRALEELFRLAEERSDQFQVTFAASVLEIYNEQIYDLLAGGRDQDAEKLDVKQGPDGMYVPGLRIDDVTSIEDVHKVINRGKGNRSTFATNMNEHSSRSHLVLSVYVHATKKDTGATLKGKLHLIDLAGSERLSRTGAQGDRLKEAQNINKSLSALGDVIQALQQKQQHIPYRNSKLTRLLEDSLGGNSKCIMVVNVSPAGENAGETKCSLEFASRARKVELGRARQTVLAASPGSEPASPGPKSPALNSPASTGRR